MNWKTNRLKWEDIRIGNKIKYCFYDMDRNWIEHSFKVTKIGKELEGIDIYDSKHSYHFRESELEDTDIIEMIR